MDQYRTRQHQEKYLGEAVDAPAVVERLKQADFSDLDKRLYSSAEIDSLVAQIKLLPGYTFLLENLLTVVLENSEIYDWNCGNIFAQFDALVLAKIVKTLNHRILEKSAGLTWAIGEVGSKDSQLIQFLREVVEHSSNSESWWNAAFALEKLGQEQAVPYLKMNLKANSNATKLTDYLKNLESKKSVIGILSLSSAVNTRQEIFPAVKELLLNTADLAVLENVAWLIGRFKFIDDEIFQKLEALLENAEGELKKNILFAIQENASPRTKRLMFGMLRHADPQFRKAAILGLASLVDFQALKIFEGMIYTETNQAVLAALTQTVYVLKNPAVRSAALHLKTYPYKENGMIGDDSDKWYGDADIYNLFSESEDPENICFGLVHRYLQGRFSGRLNNDEQNGKKPLSNPIDLACGTGRMAWQILSKLDYQGEVICADASRSMVDFVEKRILRDASSLNKVKTENAKIDELPERLGEGKSNFIISSFGFPSRIFNSEQVLKDLEAVEKLLSDDGVFVTVGWDETFNDELNEVWYKFVPDAIEAGDFEEWRTKRSALIKSPRNCGLTWFKKGLKVPLQFHSQDEAVKTMGHLFGKDAAEYALKSGKTRWDMSLGITINTKAEITKILDDLNPARVKLRGEVTN